MEIRDIFKVLKKNRPTILLFTVIGIILGVLISFVPGKYRVEGSFFVGRTADTPSNEFFTYEGYYAQQTAQSYANTAVALLESQDLRKTVLEEMDIPVTDANLRKLAKSYRISKIGPQVITITVRDYNLQKSDEMYEKISKNFLIAGEKLSSGSDSNISVVQISEFPVTRQEQKPLLPCIAGGLIAGIVLSLLKISVEEYFK